MDNTEAARGLAPAAPPAGPEPRHADTLIKAALSLSQAIEALGSLNLLGELSPPEVKNGINFYEEVERYESALVVEALRVTGGRQRKACALLGLSPSTLHCILKRLGIDPAAFVEMGGPRRRRDSQKPGRRPAAAKGERPSEMPQAVQPAGEARAHPRLEPEPHGAAGRAHTL